MRKVAFAEATGQVTEWKRSRVRVTLVQEGWFSFGPARVRELNAPDGQALRCALEDDYVVDLPRAMIRMIERNDVTGALAFHCTIGPPVVIAPADGARA